MLSSSDGCTGFVAIARRPSAAHAAHAGSAVAKGAAARARGREHARAPAARVVIPPRTSIARTEEVWNEAEVEEERRERERGSRAGRRERAKEEGERRRGRR